MKTKYINDVPSNIKALSFYGDIVSDRIKTLETRINNYQSEIYRLEDKKKFGQLAVQEEAQLFFYKNDLPKVIDELKQLKEIEPEKKENKNPFLIYLIPAILIYAIILKRKK